MQEFLLTQGEYILRMLLAAACGAGIGYERKNRLKEAGIRTHLIVSLGAALMMLVSKYGFFDLIGQLPELSKLDPSRVAAQIVSGVGFLGAGMIFVRRQSVSGLTTAAGIWATAGVGMAVGSGMYVVGIAAALMIILTQIILHRKWFRKKMPVAEQFNVSLDDSSEAIDYLQSALSENQIEILNIKVKKTPGKGIDAKIYAKFPKEYEAAELLGLFKDNPHILSIDF